MNYKLLIKLELYFSENCFTSSFTIILNLNTPVSKKLADFSYSLLSTMSTSTTTAMFLSLRLMLIIFNLTLRD